MGRRKGQNPQTLVSPDEDPEEKEVGEKGARFFACYLLTSLCPRFKGHTYIGYTVNPRRRIRQHNGEIGCGAWRTKRKRPWEMVLCIYGFPTNVAALQFEWAWQHPVESLAVRKAAASFKSISGLANKIKLAYTMLTLPPWQSMNLTVNLFSTKYQKHTSGCPTLPGQMRTQVCPMNELPCYDADVCMHHEQDDCDDEEEGYDINVTFPGTTEEPIEATKNVNPSDHDSSNENLHVESSGCLAKIQPGGQTNSPPINEDPGRQSIIIDGSPRTSSFSLLSSIIVEESTLELDRLPMTQSATTIVADEDQRLIKSLSFVDHGVEIIEIFTPSPCYRINICSKKRRATQSPEIIDLTNSPLFV